MQAAFRSTVESFQSALGLLIPETTVAYLDNLDTASQWGHGWLAQATKLPMKPWFAPCEVFPYASCQPPVSPLAAFFKILVLTLCGRNIS